MGGGYGPSPQATFWRYNPANDTWTSIASLPPGGRVEAVCFSIGNSGYLGTGWDGTNFKNDFWKYSPDSVLSGVESPEFSQAVTVYPNPVSEMLFLKSDFRNARIEIFDAAGRKVISQQVENGTPVNVQSLAAGNYTFLVIHQLGRAGGKFIKVMP
jgi:hypothetical protein